MVSTDEGGAVPADPERTGHDDHPAPSWCPHGTRPGRYCADCERFIRVADQSPAAHVLAFVNTHAQHLDERDRVFLSLTLLWARWTWEKVRGRPPKPDEAYVALLEAANMLAGTTNDTTATAVMGCSRTDLAAAVALARGDLLARLRSHPLIRKLEDGASGKTAFMGSVQNLQAIGQRSQAALQLKLHKWWRERLDPALSGRENFAAAVARDPSLRFLREVHDAGLAKWLGPICANRRECEQVLTAALKRQAPWILRGEAGQLPPSADLLLNEAVLDYPGPRWFRPEGKCSKLTLHGKRAARRLRDARRKENRQRELVTGDQGRSDDPKARGRAQLRTDATRERGLEPASGKHNAVAHDADPVALLRWAEAQRRSQDRVRRIRALLPQILQVRRRDDRVRPAARAWLEEFLVTGKRPDITKLAKDQGVDRADLNKRISATIAALEDRLG